MCEQDQLAFWTKLLNLDGFQVVHEERTAADEPRRFTVIPKVPVGLCPIVDNSVKIFTDAPSRIGFTICPLASVPWNSRFAPTSIGALVAIVPSRRRHRSWSPVAMPPNASWSRPGN